MRRLFIIGSLYLLFIFAAQLAQTRAEPILQNSSSLATLAMGITLLLSYYTGEIAAGAGLPRITGYLLAGIFFGPYAVGAIDPSLAVLSRGTVNTFKLIDHLALGIIALTAGGELRMSMIRERWKLLLTVSFVQSGIVMIGVAALVFAVGRWTPLLPPMPASMLGGFSLLLGVLAATRSPAATIAVINESKSRGPVTDVALGVNVLLDMIVVAAFTVFLVVAEILISGGGGVHAGLVKQLAWEIFGSLGVGLILGWVMAEYMKRINQELPLLVLGIAFLSLYLFHGIHLSGLLICMTAGFYVENFSKHGEALIHAIEEHSLIVYIIFFTIGGASLDLGALREAWPMALVMVGGGFTLTVLGTKLAAKWGKAEPAVRSYGWTGFISQAGVALGLAIIVEKALDSTRPPESETSLGSLFMTIVLGTIVINQIIGPIIFKVGLARAGEMHKGHAVAVAPAQERSADEVTA